MRDVVVRPYRLRGRLMTRSEQGVAPSYRGELLIFEESDRERGRAVRVAQVGAGATDGTVPRLPRLYEPVLVAMGYQGFTLAGYERVGEAEYAQSWFCALQG
jgi:hypothetical protein